MNNMTRRQQGDLADQVRELLRIEIDKAESFISHSDSGIQMTKEDEAILQKLHSLLPVLNRA